MMGIVLRAEDRERQATARDRDHAIASAMKDREHACPGAAGDGDDCRAKRVHQASELGREQRMIARQEAGVAV
jgi:hypothetical protein